MSAIWGPPPIRETVSAAAYRRLRDALLKGQIEMGARINEVEIASAWGVSRTPIRDAIRRLEAEGLLRATPRRGAVVPVVSLGDIDELYEMREILEGRAARRAALRATRDDDDRLNALIRQFGSAVKAGDLDAVLDIDLRIHAGIAETSGAVQIQKAIEGVAQQIHVVRARGLLLRGRAAKSFREMAKLVASIRARDAARAERAMHEHIASLRSDLPEAFGALHR
jgi:DNA-binding GntR family transcriptional regulator